MRPASRGAARLGALAMLVALAISGCNDDDGKVPALSQADQDAGVVRVVYPDRSLPDAPEVTVVDGTRVALFLTSVSEADGDVTAELRVAVGEGSDPVPVTLTEDASKTMRGVTITLVHGYATSDPSSEAADVKVTKG